jgi:hypothetical protein
MRYACKLLIVSLSVAGAMGVLGQGSFKPGPAASYPSHQNLGQLKIAAVKFESDEETRPPFGKLNPNEYGILPVLLIFENTAENTLLLDRMRVAYQYKGNEVLPTAAAELPYALSPKRPRTGPSYPVPIPLPKKKNPMSAVELQTRAFGAKTLLKGETASGFFYFETRHQRNAVIYITGIREGVTGKELFFAEVPLDGPGESTEGR